MTPPAARTQQVRILIADDHQMFREGLSTVLATAPDCEIVGEAPDGREALKLTRALNPDILLLDLAMPRMQGIDVLREIAAVSATTRVVLLTASIEKHEMAKAFQLGARGLILKDSERTTIRISCGRFPADSRSHRRQIRAIPQRKRIAGKS